MDEFLEHPKNPNKPTPLGVGNKQGFFDLKPEAKRLLEFADSYEERR